MTPVPTKPILFYEGPHYYLSNFSSFGIRLFADIWPTVEHAYQAEKFSPIEHASIRFQIRMALSAHQAKQIAKVNKEKVLKNWDDVKLSVMEELLRQKFAQHEYVQTKLMETGDTPLVEDSPKDAFWGRGPDGNGLNHLGKLWEKIRAEEKLKKSNRDNRRGKKL